MQKSFCLNLRANGIGQFFSGLSILIGVHGLSVSSARADSAQTNALPRTEVLVQGDLAIRQLVTPEFDALPLERKLFAYYLSLAIDSGRDITWMQATRFGFEIRHFLEILWLNSGRWDLVMKEKFRDYFFRVLVAHGNYDPSQNRKILPDLNEREFERLVRQSETQLQNQGIAHKNLRARFAALKRAIFDVDHFPHLKPTPREDLLADSASNYYDAAVTLRELKALPVEEQKHFLSYPIRVGHEIELRYFRLGDRFDYQLRAVNHYLELAKRYATDAEKEILAAHQKVIRTGDPQDQLDAEKRWTLNESLDLDFVLGFVETYGDPLNARGAWTGYITVKAKSSGGLSISDLVRGKTDYFESQMPVESRFKKQPGFRPPWAVSSQLLYSGGDNGERPFGGINLPNSQDLRARVGSKSFTLLNVLQPIGGKSALDLKREQVFFHPGYQKALKRFDTSLLIEINIILHEVLGHGSGKLIEGVTAESLEEYGSPLEEARAETAALYHSLDPNLREFGIVPSMSDEDYKKFQELSVVHFFQNFINIYFIHAENTAALTQAHQWAALVMLNWLLEKGALRIDLTVEKVPHVHVVDLDQVRQALGDLWAQVQECTSTGNKEMTADLFSKYGNYTDRDRMWRHAIVQARAKLQLPSERVYMNPRFVLVKDAAGVTTDVQLQYHEMSSPDGFIDDQIKLSRRAAELRSVCAQALNGSSPI